MLDFSFVNPSHPPSSTSGYCRQDTSVRCYSCRLVPPIRSWRAVVKRPHVIWSLINPAWNFSRNVGSMFIWKFGNFYIATYNHAKPKHRTEIVTNVSQGRNLLLFIYCMTLSICQDYTVFNSKMGSTKQASQKFHNH